MKSKTTWLSSLFAVAALTLAAAGFATANFFDEGTASTDSVKYAIHTPPPISAQEAESSIASAKQLSNAFRVASERVLPSLVTIESRAKTPPQGLAHQRGRMPQEPNPFHGTPFEDLFRQMPQQGLGFDMPQPQPTEGSGSGVIIDSSGLVMTNNHVVLGGENVECTVRLSDGREYSASKISTDPKTDIAIIQIDGARDLVPAQLGDSDRVAVGDWVLALGQPFGLESTVTAGIISAKQRGVGITERESFLQTDAAINPGNSGGPLVNLDGEVVGINTAISTRSGSNAGVGFAVPINLAKWVGDQLASTGVVRRAYLGVGIQQINATIADKLGVKPRSGVAVTMVQPGTPAADAGLQVGDVITNFAGVSVATPKELQVAVERAEIGRPHQVDIVRDGKTVTLSFIPAEQPANYSVAGSPSMERSTPDVPGMNRFGLQLSDLTSDIASRLGMAGAEGVVVTGVADGSPAAQAGLEVGQVIKQINRQPVRSAAEAEERLQQANLNEGILLLVQTPNGSAFVVMQSS